MASRYDLTDEVVLMFLEETLRVLFNKSCLDVSWVPPPPPTPIDSGDAYARNSSPEPPPPPYLGKKIYPYFG